MLGTAQGVLPSASSRFRKSAVLLRLLAHVFASHPSMGGRGLIPSFEGVRE